MINCIKYYHEQKKYFMDLFMKAKRDHKYVRIRDFYITVDFIDMSKGGCGQCRVKYLTFNIEGQMFIPDDYISHNYTATITPHAILCKCKLEQLIPYGKIIFTVMDKYPTEIEKDELPKLLFKGMITDPDIACFIWDYYLEEKYVNIVDDTNQ